MQHRRLSAFGAILWRGPNSPPLRARREHQDGWPAEGDDSLFGLVSRSGDELSNPAGQHVYRERLGQHVHARVEVAMAQHGVLRVAGPCV